MVVLRDRPGDGVGRLQGAVAARLHVAIWQQRAESLARTRVSSAGRSLPGGCVVDRQQRVCTLRISPL
jgi:hypothetical protein